MRVIIILLSFFSIVFADIGKVSTVVGDAHIQRVNKIIVIKTGLILEEKDIVKTAKNSKVQLIFKDNTVITVGKNSALSINEYLYDIKNSKNSKTDFNFFKGAFKTITGKIGKINKKKFKLRTKTASIGIRGTIIIGNQNMIACTQGGITVKGAGISVDVEANELTIIQKDNAPSQAKTITKQDLKDLKQSLEPATQLTSNETNRKKVKKKENKEEKIEKEESTHKKSSVEKTPKSEEIVQQTNKQVNNIVDDTEAQKQTQLTQAQVQVAYDKLISQAQQASLQAQAEQAKTNKAKIDTSNILDTLPSTEDMIILQNQVSNVDTTTQASLNSAISSLNNASSLESIDENAKTEVINSSVTANTSTSQALQDANSFQINTDGIYNTRLNEAQVKAIEAQTAYENAITQANIAQDALNQAQKSGAPSNVISSIQSGVEKANSAVASAHIIANEAQSAVNNLRVTINNTAGQIVTNAQTAVNNANNLSMLSKALSALENIKQANIDTNKAKIDTSNILDTLPSTEDMIILQNQVSNVDTTTQASLNSAISSLNNASSLESIDENAKTEVINSSVTANTSTSQALQDANSFQINTDGIYNTRLNEAQEKAIEAQTAYENAITQANIAQDALNQAQKSGAPSNVISSIQSGVEKANSAVASAHIIANEAQSAVNNLRVTINNTAGQIVTNAQTAVNNATILTQLSLLLNSLEDTKQASLDTSAANDSVQVAKIEIQTASNDATTASNELLSVKQTIISEKNNAISTSNDSISASNTAVNNETSNVQVAYSAKIAKDKANQAKTIANQAMANAVISANKLAAAQTAVTQMNNQLEVAQNALNLAQQNLIDTQTALNSAQGIESNINSSNTSAKVAAQNAVTKAQASYNSALNAKIAAQTAVDTAQTIVDNLDAETLLSTLTIANSEAQSDATIADNTANNAQTSAQGAITAVKIASSDVKAVILSKTNKKSLESNGNKNTLDNSLETFVLSEVKTNEQLIGNSFGGYIGSTELGVFKENENDLNPLFHVQADNLQEFFVGYSSSSNPIKSLVVYGNESTHNYDTNKIYMYKSFKNLKIENNTGNFSTKTTIHYYNPSLNSYTSLSKNFFMEGANRFVVGDEVNIKTINNSFFLGEDIYIDNIDSTSGTGSYSILGKQAQGLSQNITNINSDSSHNSEELSASFLNGKKSTDSSSINKHMTGDVFLISYEPGITGKRAENLTIDISDEGEDISAIAKYGNGSTIMSFDGSIENLSAYYINSDIFGVEASNLNAGENGFLIAVPDGAYDNGKFTIYDENDNPLTSNDDSSWGYWTGKNSFTITQRASVSPHSVWVAGIETDSSIIQGLIERELAPGESEVVTFHGKVLGVVDTVNPILMDDSNKVVLNFNLGAARANNMDGTMQFKSVNNASFNLNIDTANSTVNNTKFYGKFSGNAVDGFINHFSGKYYGDGELKSVGGIISVIQNNKNATGVFKATKQ